jgi:hypothetical protein
LLCHYLIKFFGHNHRILVVDERDIEREPKYDITYDKKYSVEEMELMGHGKILIALVSDMSNYLNNLNQSVLVRNIETDEEIMFQELPKTYENQKIESLRGF